MRRDLGVTAALVGGSAAVGWIGWSGAPLLLPMALLFPLLWSAARSRSVAAIVSAGYFLAASRGLPQGVANFYGSDLWPGLLLWLVASTAFVAVHMLLWTGKRGWHAPLRYLIATIVMAVPPFGILGWAHPLTAAGILFPGWGRLGLLATAAGLAIMTTWWWRVAILMFSGFWLWSAAIWAPPAVPQGWQGIDLALGSSLGRESGLQRQLDLIATVRQKAATARARHIVLPESAFGYWTPTVERLWRAELQGTGITVLAGAALVGPDGYDNVMVAVSDVSGSVFYRERMPVPGSMWQPWRMLFSQSGGAHAHFFANPVVAIDGVRIAPLICYEQLIVWPVLHSMLHDPKIIAAIGNGWWTRGTSIVAIQRASAIAWARLFDKLLITSFNT